MQGPRKRNEQAAGHGFPAANVLTIGVTAILGAFFIQTALGAPAVPVGEPMQLLVSLPEQKITVYKGGKLIASSRVSTGQRGYRTPAGIYSILQKKVRHRSNIYRGAPMPFMQRITWSGIALHAGHVPNYPASHGCIRLPHAFAKKLFAMETFGAHVIIAAGNSAPAEITHEKLFQPTPVSALLTSAPSSAPEAQEDAREQGAEPLATAYVSKTEPPAPSDPRSAAIANMDLEATLDRLYAYRSRSASPLRILVTRRTGREQLADVQTMLAQLGYEPGGIDGYMGPGTAAAVKGFQKAQDLTPSGIVSEALIAALYKATARGPVPTGHIYVRQDFAEIFDAPMIIKEPEKPLGLHLFTALHFDDRASQTRWLALSPQEPPEDAKRSRKPKKAARKKPVPMPAIPATVITTSEVLDRLEIPVSVRRRISDLLTPGSSFAISDNGISRETGKGTDFIVLMQ